MKMPKCKSLIVLPYLLPHLLSGLVKKGQWTLSSSSGERNLRDSWHLCFIYSPHTQLPFRTNAHTPSDHTHTPPPPCLPVHSSISEKCCSWPGPVPLPDLRLSLDGISLHCLPWDWPQSLTPSLGEAAGMLLRGLDRSWQVGREHIQTFPSHQLISPDYFTYVAGEGHLECWPRQGILS